MDLGNGALGVLEALEVAQLVRAPGFQPRNVALRVLKIAVRDDVAPDEASVLNADERDDAHGERDG
jgi:hypothetical protein